VTYEKMANDLSISLCGGPCDWGDEARHQKGGVFTGVVHWKRERITRSGIYEFLKLCWWVNNRGEPAWRAIYEQSTYATQTARSFGIVIPSLVTRYDRLRVRSLLPPETPSSDHIYKWTHKETV